MILSLTIAIIKPTKGYADDKMDSKHNPNHRFTCSCNLLLVSTKQTRRRTSNICATILILLAITATLTLTLTQAYNLDTQKALIKQGPKSSYFGFSVAEHVTFDAQSKDKSTFRSYVIVGAPRAEPPIASSVLSGSSATVRPGAVFKCDFSLSQKCQQLDIDSASQQPLPPPSYRLFGGPNNNNQSNLDSNDIAGKLFADSGNEAVVDRNNQWLGVDVKSQGPNGYAMACAHRQVLKGIGFKWGQGACYSLNKDLSFHRIWQPCLNRPVNRAHEEHGYCQVGTSADISNSSDIVMGAPGVYTWRGTFFTNSIGFSTRDDRTWYHAPMQDEDAPVNKYSYLGMSVLSGKFFNKQEYFVSGAPRQKEVGQVLFLTKQNTLGKKGESTLKVEKVLTGEQIASSFGYTLAKMDFNGDGQLDLVVSAPFYYTKNESGAVYLYANDGKTVSLSGKLLGRPESRYGFALANCGDLNKDGYEDLAVGAPYDSQGGTVYIHLGSASGIRRVPSQIIKASSVGPNLQTFGYSLSGGLDLDQNGYPDLVVGSYADDLIFILRARPIIDIITKIEGNLTKIDPNRTTCDGEKNQLPCFKFNTCFELDPAAIGEYSDSMKLKYRIEAETHTGQQKFSRVKFQESENTETPNVVEKEILMENYPRRVKLKRCNAQRVYIKDRTDIQTPISFKLTYSLVPPNQINTPTASVLSNRYSSSVTSNQLISFSSSSSGNLQSASSSSSSSSSSNQGEASPAAGIAPPFPILNQEEAQRIFTAHFLKDCGANEICESHLDVDGQLQVPKETLGINEPGYPTDKQINATIRVANSHEPAYESKLFVTYPSSLLYSGFKAVRQAVPVECEVADKGLIKCDLGNPMPRQGSTKLLMLFNTQNQAGTFDFNLMVNTTSQNSKDAKTSYDLSGTIKKKAEVQIPTRQPPTIPEPPTQEPPAWLILASILLGILLFAALFYCLYVNGFFERSRPRYTAADTEDRYT